MAVAGALRDKLKDIKLLYVGSHRPADRELVEAAGIEFRAISTGKLRRYASFQNIVDVFRFIGGVVQAQAILHEFRPDVVFAKGGYVALPVVLAAGWQKIPVVVHESDSRLGLANRIALKPASKIAVSFPIEQYLKVHPRLGEQKNKLIYTGLPVARELLEAKPKELFRQKRKTVLITGGSQGAQAINEAIWKILPELLGKYNVIHQTGELDFERAQKIRSELPGNLSDHYFIMGFETDIFRSALKSADIVVSRSGSFVFELQALGKPAVFIPLPSSASDHQRTNAQFLVEKGAALAIDQRDLTPEKLYGLIEQVLNDEKLQAELTAGMRSLGTMNITAAERIADIIIKEAKK